jgi:hypothetical protein
MNPVHPTPSYFSKIHINIILTPMYRSSYRLLSCGFPITILLCIPLFPYAYCMPSPSHPPLFDNFNYIWRILQVVKLLIIQFSPTSYHIIPLQSKYSSQHPLLIHLQSMFFPQCQTPSFTTIHN